MGKTQKRQRKKAAALAAAAPPVQKPPMKRSAATMRVSRALDGGRWDEALDALREMQRLGARPKLGAIQRWVRAADTSGSEARAARLLAAIIRATEAGAGTSTAVPTAVLAATAAAPAAADGGRAGGSGADTAAPLGACGACDELPASESEPPGTLRRFPDWQPPRAASQPHGMAGAAALDSAREPAAALDGTPRPAAPCAAVATPAALGSAPESPVPRVAAGGGVTESAVEPAAGAVHGERGPHCGAASGAGAAPDATGAAANTATDAAASTVTDAATASGTGAAADDGVHAAQHTGQPHAPPGVPPFRRLRLEPSALPPGGAPPPRIFAADVQPLVPLPPGTVVPHDVPFVPGARMLVGVLRDAECDMVRGLAEAMEFRDDVDYTTGAMGAAAMAGGRAASAARTSAGGERAAGVVLMADPEALVGPIFQRLAPHLPPQLGGGALAGINPRWRLYRYRDRGVYRPHVDGAWPGSALAPDGRTVVHDAHNGALWSRLTLVLYLNDGFEGGATTFFTAAWDADGVLEARGVRPLKGAALFFPHGSEAALVHEGSAVTRGEKIIVRTEVLYQNPPRRPGGAAD